MELTFCLSKIENYMFKPLKELSVSSFSDRLNKLLYLPLAMNSKKITNTTTGLISILYDRSND